MENIQKILDLLLPALQATHNLQDLINLKYDENKEIVEAIFSSNRKKYANVAMDSGTAMIRDLIRQIV